MSVPENGQNLDLSISLGNASFQANGAAEVVMQALAEFRELVSSAPPPPPPREYETAQDSDANAPVPSPPQDSEASNVPLPKFLESDPIKGNPAIATAIVVWAADHEGKASLTKREIEGYWKGTKLKVPANTARDIGVAVKAGWLLKGEGNTYSASGYGREAIGLS